METHLLYADLDPTNLVNSDPDPGRIQDKKVIKFSKHLSISKSPKYFLFLSTNLNLKDVN